MLLDFAFMANYFNESKSENFSLLFIISPPLLFNIIVIFIYSYVTKEESYIIRNITCLAFGNFIYITLINLITLSLEIDEIIHCQCYLLYGIFIVIDFFIISILMCIVGIFIAIKEAIFGK